MNGWHTQSSQEVRLEDILDMQHIQELNDAFAYAMDLASTVVDLRGNPIAGPSNHCRVCQLIRSTTKGLHRCMLSANKLGQKAHELKQPYSQPCLSLGFVDAAAPIIVQGQHIATWLVGQTVLADVDEQRVRDYAKEIGVDEEAMLWAFSHMNYEDPRKFYVKLDLLWRVAQNISKLGYNNLLYSKALAQLQDSQSELNRYKESLEHLVDERTKELKETLEKVELLSATDPLTGCFNRYYLHQSLEQEIRRSQRYYKSFSIVICDLDNFKNFNDQYGHQCGDHVLKEITRLIRRRIREDIDWLVRYGGEEFLLILPETEYQGAYRASERLRKEIQEFAISWDRQKMSITASFGIVNYNYMDSNQNLNSDELISIADQNLYKAKSQGKNTIYGTQV